MRCAISTRSPMSRFASVYRSFADVSEFRDEVDRLESEPPPEARRSQIPLIPDD